MSDGTGARCFSPCKARSRLVSAASEQPLPSESASQRGRTTPAEAWGAPTAVPALETAIRGRKFLQHRPRRTHHSVELMKSVQVTGDVPHRKEHAPPTSATRERGGTSRTVPELGRPAQGGPLGACGKRLALDADSGETLQGDCFSSPFLQAGGFTKTSRRHGPLVTREDSASTPCGRGRGAGWRAGCTELPTNTPCGSPSPSPTTG